MIIDSMSRLTCIAALAATTLLAQSAPPAAGDAAKLPPGDAAKGMALVEANGCLNCHRIGDKGSHMGPDLTDIGDRRTPDRLLASIVTPDAEVLPENRFVSVTLKDGTTVRGRLLNHDAFSVQLIDSKDQLRSFQTSQMKSYVILEKGLMPSFQGKLKEQDLA